MGNKEMPSDKEKIAQRLKEARTKAGLSQDQAATIIGLPRPAISEIEAGRRKVTVEEVIQFGEAYKVATSWLLLEDDDEDTIDKAQMKLAARELGKLNPDEFQKVMDVLKMIRK